MSLCLPQSLNLVPLLYFVFVFELLKDVCPLFHEICTHWTLVTVFKRFHCQHCDKLDSCHRLFFGAHTQLKVLCTGRSSRRSTRLPTAHAGKPPNLNLAPQGALSPPPALVLLSPLLFHSPWYQFFFLE